MHWIYDRGRIPSSRKWQRVRACRTKIDMHAVGMMLHASVGRIIWGWSSNRSGVGCSVTMELLIFHPCLGLVSSLSVGLDPVAVGIAVDGRDGRSNEPSSKCRINGNGPFGGREKKQHRLAKHAIARHRGRGRSREVRFVSLQRTPLMRRTGDGDAGVTRAGGVHGNGDDGQEAGNQSGRSGMAGRVSTSGYYGTKP